MPETSRQENEGSWSAISGAVGNGPIDIIEEEVDVAIRFERPTNAAFVAKRLIQDPWVVCASPSYFQIFPEMILDDDDRAIYAVYPHREYLPVKVRVFVDELESTISMRR